MKLWSWLGRNARAFEALGACVVIITAIVALWSYLKTTKPDLILWVQRDKSTIPVDLIEWSQKVANELKYLPKQLADEPPVLDRLRQLAASDTANRLPYLNPPRGLDRFMLGVINQAKHTVSGIRLHVTGLQGPLWGVDAWGSFLTGEEDKDFTQKVKSALGAGYNILVLPELPPLPPQNSLRIDLFGPFEESSEATIKVPADNFVPVHHVTLERSWLIDMYMNPSEIVIPAILLLLFFILLGSLVIDLIKKRIMYNAACIMYNAASHEALEGHSDAAMHLLEKAFEASYLDREHVKRDPNLEALRTREDFKKLIGDPPESTP